MFAILFLYLLQYEFSLKLYGSIQIERAYTCTSEKKLIQLRFQLQFKFLFRHLATAKDTLLMSPANV